MLGARHPQNPAAGAYGSTRPSPRISRTIAASCCTPNSFVAVTVAACTPTGRSSGNGFGCPVKTAVLCLPQTLPGWRVAHNTRRPLVQFFYCKRKGVQLFIGLAYPTRRIFATAHEKEIIKHSLRSQAAETGITLFEVKRLRRVSGRIFDHRSSGRA